VPGRGHWTIGSGRMVVRFGRGPITFPTGQPSESLKYVETGTSLYVGLRRLPKLVGVEHASILSINTMSQVTNS
jgi:hypothetical protein